MGEVHFSGRHQLLSFSSFLTSVCVVPCRCPFFSLDTETTAQNTVKSITARFLSLLSLLPHIVRRALEIKLSSQARTQTHTCTRMHTFILAACTLFSCRCEGHPPGPFHEALPFLSLWSPSIQLQSQHQPDATGPLAGKGSASTHIFHLLNDKRRAAGEERKGLPPLHLLLLSS